jgi:diaminohydroxyphosphoribosylaminopyrimidine deaminase / 5-amino-6-(5-phosphoribosylamino)uracil reductase
MNNDKKLMARAIEIAARGIGTTSPNPRVGAVIVKGGKIIAEGWHKRPGGDHAEVAALKKIGYRAGGATMYVSLEPCSTHGRTPPCTEAIIKSRIKRVVVAMSDPNPAHRGRGLRILRADGIETNCGILRKEAAEINRGFVKFHTNGFPWVIAKAAMSFDGKMATVTGDSKWITNKKARNYAHQMRHESDAVVVGLNTALLDDPELTVRHVKCPKKHPLRVVVDPMAEISLNAKMLNPELAEGTLVAISSQAPEKKIEKIERKGAGVLICRGGINKINLGDMLKKLARQGVLYVMIEGGGSILSSAFDAGLVDEVAFFYAPILIGGKAAPTPFGGKGAGKISEALRLDGTEIKTFDDNLLIRGIIKK